MSPRALKIAIVGRPNVGKSTLFNRLAGRKLAIVDDRPGVTRDRREAAGRLGDLDLELVDTAGFEDATDESLEARMRRQTEAGVAMADLCLLLIDARAGLMPADEGFAALLRKSGRPVIVCANKAEGGAGDVGITEAWTLGFGEPVPMSGEHGEGMSDLYAAILRVMGDRVALPEPEADPDPEDDSDIGLDADPEAGFDIVAGDEVQDGEPKAPLRIAVIGRPNAGKSTLVNALIGDERLLTGPEAGITRDAISVDWMWNGRQVRLVDTAGMRRKARVQEKLETLSVADTLRSIRFAEICLLVMDAGEAFEKQDLQIADLVAREGRGLVYVIAKWDQIDAPQARLAALQARADTVLPQTRGAPLVPVSALSGIGLERLMPAVASVHEDWNARVKTRDLNDWLAEAVARQPPPTVDGVRVKPRYIAQIKARPPTFVLIASRAARLPESYVRYLVNGIRKAFDMPAVPIRFFVRAPRNPFAADSGDDRSARARSGRTSSRAARPRPAGAESAAADAVPPPAAAEAAVQTPQSTGEAAKPDGAKGRVGKTSAVAGRKGPGRPAAARSASAKPRAARQPDRKKPAQKKPSSSKPGSSKPGRPSRRPNPGPPKR